MCSAFASSAASDIMTNLDGLTRLSQLADDMFDAETNVARAEAELQAAKKVASNLAEHDLPDLMDDLELTSFVSKSGVSVSVLDKVSAGKLTQANPEALEWLRQNNQGGLIKTLVSVPFTAGSESDADDLVEQLAGEGFASTKGMEVHHSSNAAAIKAMLADGVDVPIKLLKGYQRRVAKITVKK